MLIMPSVYPVYIDVHEWRFSLNKFITVQRWSLFCVLVFFYTDCQLSKRLHTLLTSPDLFLLLQLQCPNSFVLFSLRMHQCCKHEMILVCKCLKMYNWRCIFCNSADSECGTGNHHAGSVLSVPFTSRFSPASHSQSCSQASCLIPPTLS